MVLLALGGGGGGGTMLKKKLPNRGIMSWICSCQLKEKGRLDTDGGQ
jgi:hypothetical protein